MAQQNTRCELKNGNTEEMIQDFLEKKDKLKEGDHTKSLVFTYEGKDPSEFSHIHTNLFMAANDKIEAPSDYQSAKVASYLAEASALYRNKVEPSVNIVIPTANQILQNRWWDQFKLLFHKLIWKLHCYLKATGNHSIILQNAYRLYPYMCNKCNPFAYTFWEPTKSYFLSTF